jgi:hypothetical protein
MILGLAGVCAAILVAQGDDGSRLSSADITAYRRALEPSSGPAEPVEFRDLWARPEVYRGRRVRVEGRVVRRFAQPPVGEFPALTELWVVTPDNNPLCLVYPTPDGEPDRLGASMAFTGTFLRRVRYQGGDAPRLAPLIVGGRPPEPLSRAETVDATAFRLPTWAYWAAGVPLAAGLAVLMAWLQMQRPVPRPPLGGRVEFEDGATSGPANDGVGDAADPDHP